MGGIYNALCFDRLRLMRISHLIRLLALASILAVMLALFIEFHRAGLIFSRGSSFPAYMMLLSAAYGVCVFIEYLSCWWQRDRRFYLARTFVHAAAILLVSYEAAVFVLAGGTAHAGIPRISLLSGFAGATETILPHVATAQTPRV